MWNYNDALQYTLLELRTLRWIIEISFSSLSLTIFSCSSCSQSLWNFIRCKHLSRVRLRNIRWSYVHIKTVLSIILLQVHRSTWNSNLLFKHFYLFTVVENTFNVISERRNLRFYQSWIVRRNCKGIVVLSLSFL